MSQTFADESVIIEAELSRIAEKLAIDIEAFLLRMSLSGADQNVIVSTLFSDLKQSGVLFGSFKNGIKNVTKDALLNVANISAEKEFIDAGVQTFKWITISDNPCPDCLGREGEVGTKEYFDAIGNPKSGFSVCGRHCQCQLVPATYKGATKLPRKKP